MRDSKNSLMWYVFVSCISCAYAQILAAQPQFAPNIDRSQQLSLQQQGQILSDIQQHHRFGLAQNQAHFQPQHFRPSQNIFSTTNPSGPQPTLSNYDKPRKFGQNEFLNTLPLVNSLPTNIIPTPQQSSQQFTSPTIQSTSNNRVVFPSSQEITNPNNIVQHHTQTNFQPSYARNNQQFNQQQSITPRPTTDPLTLIEQQIRSLDPKKHEEKIKELREKQAIIEKHNQFVEKQYEKSLKKAQEDHAVFVNKQQDHKKKLYQRVYKPSGDEPITRFQSSRPRVIYPDEVGLFERAVRQYYQEHPTTTTTTTTTTTPKPSTTARKVSKANLQSFLPTALPQTKVKTIQSLEDLDQLQKQYKSQRIRKDDLLEQLRLAIGNNEEDKVGRNLSSREISLANGKKVQLITADDSTKLPAGKEEEITLPDGKKVTVIRADDPNNKSDEEVILPSAHQVQIIRTTDPNAIPFPGSEGPQEITLPNGQKAQLVKSSAPRSTTAAPPTFRTEEITLPNGEKVEVIKTSDPSLVPGGVQLEPGSDLEKLVLSRTTTTTTIKPPKEILEELTKNVPSSDYEILKTGASGGLESIGKNLPNQRKVTFVLLEEQSDGTLKVQGIKGNGKDKPDVDVDSILKKIKRGEIKLPNTSEVSTTTSTSEKPDVTTTYKAVAVTFIASTTPTTVVTQSYSSSSTTSRAPTRKTSRTAHILNTHSNDQLNLASSLSSSNQNSISSSSQKPTFTTSSVTIQQSITPENVFPTQETYTTGAPDSASELPDILRKNGLFAMAKFLRQSGLDTILNETGPYTVFVPSDKAFKTLLIQLGGPERAEEKFKDNPRLLSGLLLHHVIPGAFKLGSLQEEMTGVSLAGTQLRVNQYNMHDNEWNDIKVTTINGAKISDDKKDIKIPQGIAHAVDRVMFPLPVGDIVQTLQSDRERRFTSFLRAIFASGLNDMLQGTKTFTVFAPTEKAFAGLSATDLSKIVTDKVLARELVLRHILAGTLYTNGMRYYQIKDSLLQDKQLTFSKQSGKVKVNNNLLATQNIPTTNGVIHAIDSLL
ncbi:hypothetical protein JTB14_029756 [Gonioctena quinquepunctata]|nr:hypothetical protein JTB14_029756 [Gonioctena quinquepunctata]